MPTTIRVCSCNGEWMNDWFTTDSDPVAFKPTFSRDGHTSNTAATASRLAAELRAIDADVVAMQEAPSRPAEMQLFITQYLSDAGTPRYSFFLGDSGGAQKLALLYKPGAVASAQLAPSTGLTELIDGWEADVDGDSFLDLYQFTRQPLVVDLTFGGHAVQFIVMHTKSNFVNQGEAMWNNPATHQNYIVAALLSRRRNGTEGMRLRTYLDRLLAANHSARLVVLGDLNDGPGMDYFEEKYLAHNVTDIVVGSSFQPEWVFTHAQHDVPVADRYSAVFDDFVTNEPNRKMLLDHILLSPGFKGSGGGVKMVHGSGTIHHAEYAANTVNNGQNREDRPSDHRPVSVQLRF
jgi:endonuclease/exonuclease/phosphatase family metal-dependent hydrolase